MTINKFMRGQLEKRDPYCVHCGETADLVIHHRKNRGMGGSKVLDTYENLLRVCQSYNTSMESNSDVAAEARGWSHKLESWEDFSEPIYDRCDGEWYQLMPDGTKKAITRTIHKLF